MMLYIETSKRSNIVCHTIQTINDIPIMYPPSFNGLGCVPFNINPHYLDPAPSSTHMGETREKRIQQFFVFNNHPVNGIREGAMILCQGNANTLKRSSGARLFIKNKDAKELQIGQKIKDL